MKKRINSFSVIIVLMITILVVYIMLSHEKAIDISGLILLRTTPDNSSNTITIYDCFKKEFNPLPVSGYGALFSENDSIFVQGYDTISEYDLNTGEEKLIYQGDPFDYFTVCKSDLLSISRDNSIFLYDIKSKESIVLINDNSSSVHSWSENGDVLYYSDLNNKIKSVNILSGKIEEIGEGNDPVVCGFNIAYRNNNRLIVKNIQTGKKYEYFGGSYSYCFSPTVKELLVEDEMTIDTGLRNVFTGGIFIGHRVVVWDYANNRKNTIIDVSVPDFRLICDWK